MPSVNCEVSITVTSSANYIILSAAVANQAAVFAITDTKVYVPVVTLSRHDYVKLLQQLKSHFKRTIDWNKYHFKVTAQRKKQYSG